MKAYLGMGFLVLVSFASAGELPGAGALLAPGVKVEKLWDKGSFTEGGAVAEDGAILFSDIGDQIMTVDPETGGVIVSQAPSGRPNGLIFDAKGRLIIAKGVNTGGGRRVSVTERDGRVPTLASGYQGQRFNSPNDQAIDKHGHVYVSDPRDVGAEPRELDFEGVFRIDLDESVHRLETTARKPNGLAISPDGWTLHVADTGPDRKALLALDPADGHVSHPRVLHDFGDPRGIDGMTATNDGRIVTASGGRAGKSLYRVSTTMMGFPLRPVH